MITETELKLVPCSAALLETLAGVERLGPFVATGHRRELQRNSFFDNAARTLGREHLGFRRRVVDGQRMAIWTIKGAATHAGGVASRAEVELALDPDMPPALALNTLSAAARSRGAPAVAEAVESALASGGLPLARPVLETETERRIVDLAGLESQIELALDRMRIPGHDYTEVEIEAELKHGPEEALSAVRAAIEALGRVQNSEGSKLSRALAHVRSCACGATPSVRPPDE